MPPMVRAAVIPFDCLPISLPFRQEIVCPGRCFREQHLDLWAIEMSGDREKERLDVGHRQHLRQGQGYSAGRCRRRRLGQREKRENAESEVVRVKEVELEEWQLEHY